MIVLSFGGKHNGSNSHTLMMKYHSVWDDQTQLQNNEWKALIHPETKEKLQLNDYGLSTRAYIGGTNNNLLFISSNNSINVIDITTCQYLPVDGKIPMEDSYQCIIPFAPQNEIAVNEFVLIGTKNCMRMKYDEKKLNFSRYQSLQVYYWDIMDMVIFL
ncbi:hypothetical protein RFI_33127 [Reticulomyxa filosa]|uniref:Uncharacterized protein n=1 Tax=Reticulomyxa filosa TaxID=46433 RepID=X6LRK8_RETFI|nr:hypothetical protein RFI_33127 [Reticulomyxa filosa]|eukprot:ETO04269.1 hypothetical protein RFI_33127 [Reticulomyxa filosa]